MKERVSVTVDRELSKRLGETVKKERIPRSRIIEEALKLWERKRLEGLLRQGYEDSAQEDRELAEFDLASGNDVMEG